MRVESGELIRIGQGYDVHRLCLGRELVLGGVLIPFEMGLLGHSDADVLCHAVCDALLGALALGDLGKFFPPNDPEYKGISSLVLLRKTYDMIKERGYLVSNIDSVVVCERPKLMTYIDNMRENIANSLECDISQISVKATTEEGLGFTGRGEGIAAHSVVLIASI